MSPLILSLESPWSLSGRRVAVGPAVVCAFLAMLYSSAAQAQPSDPPRFMPPRTTSDDSAYFDSVNHDAANFDAASFGEMQPPAGATAYATDQTFDSPFSVDPSWEWTLLPNTVLYPSYLAGAKESRFASFWAYEQDLGWIWDVTLGGRLGLLRYGGTNEIRPEGWQLDIEGAAFPRLDLEENRDLVSVDFRFGLPLTRRVGRFQTKLAYYHLSSHIADEFLEKNAFTRINFSRDVIVLGEAFHLTDDLRLYAEVGWAFYTSGGSEPFEFQFGVDYSPLCPPGRRGAPFFAVNTHLREEVDFGGNLVVQAGWQWRGCASQRLLRAGVQYYNGKSDQYEFFANSEQKIGLGVWLDF